MPFASLQHRVGDETEARGSGRLAPPLRPASTNHVCEHCRVVFPRLVREVSSFPRGIPRATSPFGTAAPPSRGVFAFHEGSATNPRARQHPRPQSERIGEEGAIVCRVVSPVTASRCRSMRPSAPLGTWFRNETTHRLRAAGRHDHAEIASDFHRTESHHTASHRIASCALANSATVAAEKEKKRNR